MIRAAWLLLVLTGIAAAEPVTEERITHADCRFRVVRAAPSRLQLVWKDGNGIPFRTFDRVQSDFSRRGKTIRFLMNAGIFEEGGIPCGLHIENGKLLRPLNLADAPGNFFLKPNGVLWLSDDQSPHIAKSEDFAAIGKALLAIQSGPLLLMDGKRHPAFKEGSPNKLHRNGVGVNEAGQWVFAITQSGDAVNLWDFAGLFLKLGCRNALFLDGDISQCAVNPPQPVRSNAFGAMFVITD